MLTLAGVGDLLEEVRDPMRMMSSAYKAMYGFIPNSYSRRNFSQAVWRSFRTGDIEKIIKNNKQYLRLTGNGKDRMQRDFPLLGFSRKWNRKWVILIFDIDEKQRKLRNVLRNKLKNIGFGMLQQSVWITPLPIVGEMSEFIDSNNLREYVFVLEVSSLLLGNSKELATRVWGLNKVEEKQIELEEKKKNIDASLKKLDGRFKNGEKERMSKPKNDYVDNDTKKLDDGMEKTEERKREIRKQQLELILSLPFAFNELLPDKLRKSF